ncbi:MAG: Beta-lactamase [Myxococcaceae bacterium]|nr:Beta-lactamase [Myxococcaceae bacterium]
MVIAVVGCRSVEKASASADASADADARADADADARGRAAMERAGVPGIAYAVVTRERERLGGTGVGDLERRSVVTAGTVFEAASIAKLLVATCVMQLVEEGTLDLDADASKYVGFAIRHPRSATPITLRMLLGHRASIEDRQDEIGAPRAGNALAPFLQRYMIEGTKPRAAAFLDAPPGTSTTYSNVGASIAALAVEHVVGASFADVSTRRVLVPLRMLDTTWVAPARPSVTAARPYARTDGGFLALPSPSHALYPAVDLHSSARDLARFARAVLRDGELDGARILSASSVRAMTSAVAGDADQALAWQLRTIGPAQTRVAGHEGEDAGATTALFLDLATGTGAVVLANGDAFASGDAARAAAIQALLADLLAAAAPAAH